MWRADESGVLVGDRIARYRDPAHAAERWAPSFALLREVRGRKAVGPAQRVRPEFAEDAGVRLVRVVCERGTDFYGTGEVPGALRRNGRVTVAWCTDAFQYDDETLSLYQAHPWVLAVRPDGSAFGVLCDTSWRCAVETAAGPEAPDGIVFRVWGPAPAVYVVERDTPEEVVRALAELTGFTPMPPRWALGYHQCRWSYEPEDRVREIAREFRARRMPCDVIWLDIDSMDGYRCFTFDPVKFPDPKGLNDDLHGLGFRAIYMIDPGIKAEQGYTVYESGRAGGHFTLDDAGREFQGMVWPGSCAFPDFTRNETRRWWADLYRDFLDLGIDGVWNDMNEPAVFDGPERTMPLDAIHRADPELGGEGPHARYHNVYGMLMVRATREGIQRARPDRRPFVLTRANYIGGQRYAATWTGDNESTWTQLGWSIPMVLNLTLSGQPFAGPDIGGFFGQADHALFARWMGIGALLPFARGHSIKDSLDHEPWSFGPDCERACRLALERRYRLLPYLYTLFREAATSGTPIVRPLFFADPGDPGLRNAEDSFLLGPDILVRCSIASPADKVQGCQAPRPNGIWRRFELSDEVHADLPEVHLRGGAILPVGPVMEHTDERPLDPLTLYVSLDLNGEARGTLYEDEGDGFGFTRGDFLLTTYRATRRGDVVEVEVESSEGKRPRAERALEVVVLTEDGIEARGAGRDGETVRTVLGKVGAGEQDAREPGRPRPGVAQEASGRDGDAPAHRVPSAPMLTPFGIGDIARVTGAQTRSISAENPTGEKSGGALAKPGDEGTTPAAAALGRGWKVRPCLRDLMPGQTVTLADIEGPGVIQHVWCTVLAEVHRWLSLRVYYDGAGEPSIAVPLGDFFANGIDGNALVSSQVIAVNPKGGMNSYWPMPFRGRCRIEITNDGPKKIDEFFYQVTWSREPVAEDAGYLHASWRRSLTTRERPEHVILDGVRGAGHYAGTYLVWNQLSNGWWGEGEVKFFIDGDPPDAPTICGTGTEDYFGGAWGFVMDHARDMRPATYSTAFLGYPQAVYGGPHEPHATMKRGPIVPAHGLYRWHIPDPIRFQRDLRVTVQALGWWPTGTYQPLTDDIASTAFWYQAGAGAVRALPGLGERFGR